MTSESFSLDLECVQWVKIHPRGQRSAAVNRAIHFYMQHGSVMEARDRLQDLVFHYSEEIESLRSRIYSLERADVDSIEESFEVVE
jgi:hypothetical protein